MRAWINGRLLESPDVPAVSVLDHGFVVGDGVFESVQVADGRPFALTRHLERIKRSAEGVGLAAPDDSAVREGVAATLEGSAMPFGRIRITMTSGIGPLGSPRGSGPQTLTVVAEEAQRPPALTAIATAPWARNEKGALTGLKTTSYAENAIMIEHAHARGASEAVMANTAGQLCEGTGSNIFYVLGGQVVTPTLESGCLAGITRALVLEWCRDEVDIVERDDTLDVLQRAEEVFLAGTTRDVQAVSSVDDRTLDAPGPLTVQIAKIWTRESARTNDP